VPTGGHPPRTGGDGGRPASWVAGTGQDASTPNATENRWDAPMTSMKNRASTSCGTVTFEQGVDGCRAEGSGEEVALAELAAELTQGRQLLGSGCPHGHAQRQPTRPDQRSQPGASGAAVMSGRAVHGICIVGTRAPLSGDNAKSRPSRALR
jgi:hypothetical protein